MISLPPSKIGSNQVRSTKAGINTYLSGYMREENMRFRENKIMFEQSAPDEHIDDEDARKDGEGGSGYEATVFLD